MFALLGPNGAGKSTKTVATLLEPDSGSVTIGSHDVIRDKTAARSCSDRSP